MDDSFQVCRCMDTVADRIGFAIREERRYEDGGMAWYVCLQGQGETGLYSVIHMKEEEDVDLSGWVMVGW